MLSKCCCMSPENWQTQTRNGPLLAYLLYRLHHKSYSGSLSHSINEKSWRHWKLTKTAEKNRFFVLQKHSASIVEAKLHQRLFAKDLATPPYTISTVNWRLHPLTYLLLTANCLIAGFFICQITSNFTTICFNENYD